MNDLTMFGTDPLWLSLVKALGIFVMMLLLTILMVWYERRVVGRMQMRLGPNRVGPFGLLQALMDGVKLALKEEIIPKGVHTAVYWIAPVISTTTAFLAFAVTPFGGTVSMFGVETQLQLTDFPVSVLYVLAIASISIYGIVLAGWSSGSPYALLGGIRSSAQMISYEIAMGLSFVAVFLYAGSMSTSQIVVAQEPIWYAVILLPSFLIYVTSMVGETNRAPFDLPEAEGELVGGFHTEYSSLKFALFFLAEYMNMIAVSAMATTLFLGGYLAPWPFSSIAFLNQGWWGMLWWFLKVLFLLWVFVWLRGTLPRYRYDQFMKIGWKFLIPVSIAWILIVATARVLRNEVALSNTNLLIAGGVVIIVLLAASWFWQGADDRKAAAEAAERTLPPLDGRDEAFPVPPMPGQQVQLTSRRSAAATTIVQERSDAEEATDG